jgi:hypothetical protein
MIKRWCQGGPGLSRNGCLCKRSKERELRIWESPLLLCCVRRLSVSETFNVHRRVNESTSSNLVLIRFLRYRCHPHGPDACGCFLALPLPQENCNQGCFKIIIIKGLPSPSLCPTWVRCMKAGRGSEGVFWAAGVCSHGGKCSVIWG